MHQKFSRGIVCCKAVAALDVEYQHVVHPPLRHDAGGLLPRAEWGRTKL